MRPRETVMIRIRTAPFAGLALLLCALPTAVGLLTLAGAAVGSAHRSRASAANGAVRILIMTVSLGRKLRH